MQPISTSTPTASRLAHEPERGVRVLVACDGTAAPRGAVTIASLLARRGADVLAFSVVEPFYTGMPEFGVLPHPALDSARIAARADDVRRELATVPGTEAWPIEVSIGLPAGSITRTAANDRDSLIVVGLGHHRLSDRLFGQEAALQISRLADRPVLAVPPDARELPSIAVVGVDFSAHSLHAAQRALRLFPDLSWMYLVHVRPTSLPAVAPDDLDELTRFRETLVSDTAVPLQSVVLSGDDPAESLLRFVPLSRADLIVAGTHGYGFFSRLVHGSVSTKLLRGAATPILITPLPRDPVEDL